MSWVRRKPKSLDQTHDCYGTKHWLPVLRSEHAGLARNAAHDDFRVPRLRSPGGEANRKTHIGTKCTGAKKLAQRARPQF